MTIDLWTLPKKKKIEKDDEEETEEREQSSLERMADRRPTRTSSSVEETPTTRPARFLQLVAAAGSVPVIEVKAAVFYNWWQRRDLSQ